MHDRDNPKWPSVRRVRNKIVARIRETQRPCCEVGAAVALVGERYKRLDGGFNCIDHSIRGKLAVLGDEFPNGVKINFSLWVKAIPDH